MDAKWQFWIDRGGTFTDLVARDPEGQIKSHKLLSENPERYDDAAIEGIRQMLGLRGGLGVDTPLPADKISAIKMGTTVATNALLERAGEATLLLTTKGFKDCLYIGDQMRPELFAIAVKRIEPLYAQSQEVLERVDAHGTIIDPLDLEATKTALQSAFDEGLRSVAIVFMHGYRFPAHELVAGKIAQDVGFTQVTLSHKASPLMKLVSRGETAVADAYLSPILHRYVERVSRVTGDIPLYFMMSSGGLTAANNFDGKDAILSGPAGGIVGAAETAKRAGFTNIIGFDMGGTSTDVSHYKGRFERTFDSVVAGVKLKVPMMDIHTVAAGGGSICEFIDGRYRVGPASAGANPGPASYGRGGPLTVTDCNLWLGRIQARHFPNVFGPEGDQPLDLSAVEQRLHRQQKIVAGATMTTKSLNDIAEGFLKIAIEHMARAIKKISIEKGHDLSRYCLQCFGGAGGQFAADVADALGLNHIMIHPLAGVLSAYGMGLARLTNIQELSLEVLSDDNGFEGAKAAILALEEKAKDNLVAQGANQKDIRFTPKLYLKYKGSDTALEVAATTDGSLKSSSIAAFGAAHKQQFGFIEPDKDIIIETVVVEAAETTPMINDKPQTITGIGRAIEILPIAGLDPRHNSPVYDRYQLTPDVPIDGPALIIEPHGTNVLPDGWQAVRTELDDLIFKRTKPRKHELTDSHSMDPILLEVFNNRFMGIAEEMGAILEKTAHSVNVKERLDFSCAIFDSEGNLVANAPHMPVHLGSMGESVITIAERNKGTMVSDDVFMLNDPYHGGTHLPDITIVTPVFLDWRKAPSFFVASRGHHADIGGITPGSMPANSTTIMEEGIVFDNVKLVKAGRFQEGMVRDMLTNAQWPARNPDQNLADLKAQVAANTRGVTEVLKLVDDYGAGVVSRYMGYIQDNAEEAVRSVIATLEDGAITYTTDMGTTIQLVVTVDKISRSAVLNFIGTSDAANNNFNAPKAITMAAVLYVFRVLANRDIPLNAGCLIPLTVIVPKGSMLNPAYPHAVVAGNVETSQMLTNALFLCLNQQAAAQGTMNNFIFGDDEYQYYETIAGGTGAGPTANGESAVQVHMTNSRLTDPEVLEWRFPVLLTDFKVRKGSGGEGKFKGGDGTIRELKFLREMDVSIISSHRTLPPPGLNGGHAGKCGENSVKRASGTIEPLKGADQTKVFPGDSIIIKTPGGGGWG
jgi:5-oxoprolinase (ATP-hydrolysing)